MFHRILQDAERKYTMMMPMLWRDVEDEMMNPFTNWTNFADDFFGKDSMNMKTDVIEEDNDYKLQADLPGFNKEDIGVSLENGMLTISANHKEDNEEKNEKGKYIRRERKEMSFQRSFSVGSDIQANDINAEYQNGVLTLILPKKALEQRKEVARIEVK